MCGMKYQVTLFSNSEINEMDDNRLYQEIKSMKQLIYKIRKEKGDSKEVEEEVSYLQAEAQDRGFNT
jgi:hypothetical protein